MKLTMKLTADGLIRGLRWNRERMLEAIIAKPKTIGKAAAMVMTQQRRERIQRNLARRQTP